MNLDSERREAQEVVRSLNSAEKAAISRTLARALDQRDEARRLLPLADQAHEAVCQLWSPDAEPKWWIDLGNLLDEIDPKDFIRNTGMRRG